MVMSFLRFSSFLLMFTLAVPLQARPVSVQVFDALGQPVAGAVLSLAGKPNGTSADVAVMDQINKQLSPAVLAVATGTAVSFPNRDDIRHQVYSFSSAKRFELRLYEGTPSAPVTFDEPGLVVLGCNIHDWMLGYVYVTDDPWFAVSDEQGRIQLNVPAGQYPSPLWHPALVDMRPIDAGLLQMGAAPIELTLPVSVTAALQLATQAPTPFADALRKAARAAPQP